MSILNRKLRRDLLGSKAMLSAVVAIIALGIACFVSMVSMFYNMDGARRSYYARCRMADFWVDLKKAPLTELDVLQSVHGITEYLPRIVFEVTVDLEGEEKPLSGRVISLPDLPKPIINNIVLRSGGYFTDFRREEVILHDAFARARKIRVGQTIHLILNNRRQEVTVVGTAISSEFVHTLGPGALIPDPNAYGVFWVKQSFAEDAFDMQGACNQIVGLLNPDAREQTDEVLRQIETRLDSYGVAATTPQWRQSSHWFLNNELRQLRISVTIMPSIFLTVAALILNVLMMRVAEHQRTIVGVLKALGYTDREILWHYLQFGMAVGGTGGIVGGGAGYVLAGWLAFVYRSFFEFPELPNRAYPGVILAGVLISTGCAVLGAIRGVWSVMKLAPAEAMRPKPPPHGRRVFLERWPNLWKRLDFRWHLVLRGIVRHRMRTVAGLFAAGMGTTLTIMGLHTRDAMDEIVHFQFDRLLLSDFEITLKDARHFSALYEAKRWPGVDYAEPVFMLGCTFEYGHHRRQGAITGVIPGARLTVPRDGTGRPAVVPKSGILLTSKLAQLLHVKAGDLLTIQPTQGLREPLKLPVSQVVDSYLGLSAYADLEYLSHAVGEQDAISMLQLKVHPGDAEQREFYRTLKELPAVQSVGGVREAKRKMVEVIVEKMMVSITLMILFAGMIFFGSVLNASLISLAERETEIATFRVLGYTPREVGTIFLRESLLVNVTGTLLGMPIAYLFCAALVQLYDTELYRIPLVIQPKSWLITFGLGVVFTLLAYLPVRRVISRMNVLAASNGKE